MTSKSEINVKDLLAYLLHKRGVFPKPEEFHSSDPECMKEIIKAILVVSYSFHLSYGKYFESIWPDIDKSPDTFQQYIIAHMMNDNGPPSHYTILFSMSVVSELFVYCFIKGGLEMVEFGCKCVEYVFESRLKKEFYRKGGWQAFKCFLENFIRAYNVLEPVIARVDHWNSSFLESGARGLKYLEQLQEINAVSSSKSKYEQMKNLLIRQIHLARVLYRAVDKCGSIYYSNREQEQEVRNSSMPASCNHPNDISKETCPKRCFKFDVNKTASQRTETNRGSKYKFGIGIEIFKIPSFSETNGVQYAAAYRPCLRDFDEAKLDELTDAQKDFVFSAVQTVLQNVMPGGSRRKRKIPYMRKQLGDSDVEVSGARSVHVSGSTDNPFFLLENVTHADSENYSIQNRVEKFCKKPEFHDHSLSDATSKSPSETNDFQEPHTTLIKGIPKSYFSANSSESSKPCCDRRIMFYSADFDEGSLSRVGEIRFPRFKGLPFKTFLPKQRHESENVLQSEIIDPFSDEQFSYSHVKVSSERVHETTATVGRYRMCFILFPSLETAVYLCHKSVRDNAQETIKDGPKNFVNEVLVQTKSECKNKTSEFEKWKPAIEIREGETLGCKNKVKEKLIVEEAISDSLNCDNAEEFDKNGNFCNKNIINQNDISREEDIKANSYIKSEDISMDNKQSRSWNAINTNENLCPETKLAAKIKESENLSEKGEFSRTEDACIKHLISDDMGLNGKEVYNDNEEKIMSDEDEKIISFLMSLELSEIAKEYAVFSDPCPIYDTSENQELGSESVNNKENVSQNLQIKLSKESEKECEQSSLNKLTLSPSSKLKNKLPRNSRMSPFWDFLKSQSSNSSFANQSIAEKITDHKTEELAFGESKLDFANIIMTADEMQGSKGYTNKPPSESLISLETSECVYELLNVHEYAP